MIPNLKPPTEALAIALLSAALSTAAMTGLAGPSGGSPSKQVSPVYRHRIVYHVSGNDPAAMQHALSSADNAFKLYSTRGERARIEIVANGSGVHMMRDDTTPVRAMLQYMRETYPDLVLTACGTTKTIMETNEKQPIRLLDGVGVTPAGIVRLIELEEQGYAYVKP